MIADIILKAIGEVVKLVGLALDGDDDATQRLSNILDEPSQVELAALRQDRHDEAKFGKR